MIVDLLQLQMPVAPNLLGQILSRLMLFVQRFYLYNSKRLRCLQVRQYIVRPLLLFGHWRERVADNHEKLSESYHHKFLLTLEWLDESSCRMDIQSQNIQQVLFLRFYFPEYVHHLIRPLFSSRNLSRRLSTLLRNGSLHWFTDIFSQDIDFFVKSTPIKNEAITKLTVRTVLRFN